MSKYQVKKSAVIDAPPGRVYAILSDYHEGHPAILPKRYFTAIQVIEGGQGTGTVLTVEMNVFGIQAFYEMTVTEPEPGRILQETDTTAGVVTTFTVDPINAGAQSKVTITTTARTSPGLKGWVEKLVNPAITRRIYRAELAQLGAVVAKGAASHA